jgi:NO-binding membrane sensor protein with MHYT domain
MHIVAFLGFDVPASPIRFHVPLALASLAFSVAGVGIGLLIVGHGPRRFVKVLVAGPVAAAGILAMHYTGMRAVHLAGELVYDRELVAASVILAVVAASLALWFAVTAHSWGRITLASAVIAAGVCCVHYLGMAAVSVRLDTVPGTHVTGIRPLTMIVPITIMTAATIVAVALSALQAMTEEEFTDGAGTPRRGVHAETAGNPWSLKQMSPGPVTGRRPSPRPVPLRSTPGS